MNVIQLEYFRAVMECGSVTEAARRLCVTQPAVSKQIRLLEEEFDCGLFSRERNRFRPTPAARFLAGKLQDLLPGFRSIPSEMDAFLRRAAGKLRIGCGPFASACMLPDLIVELLKRHPGIEPEISEKDSFWRDLETGTLDIMIGAQNPESENFVYGRMISGPLVVIASADSPLAKCGKVTKSLLASQRYLSISFDPLRGNIFRKMPYLLEKRFIVESRYSQTLISYVRRNLGFSILPDYLLDELPENVVKVRYDTGLKSELGYMLWANRPETPQLKALLMLLGERYPDKGKTGKVLK